MDTIINLNQCSGLKDVKTILDVGAKNADFAKRLLNFKIEKENITLTDIQPLEGENTEGFNFIQTSIEDMSFSEKFDLVVCARVLPFTKKPLENLRKILPLGKTVYFSLFGKNDEREGLPRFSQEEIKDILNEFPNKKCIYKAEVEYDGTLYNGDKIHWHEYRIVLQDK